jgi:hypothetical protein
LKTPVTCLSVHAYTTQQLSDNPHQPAALAVSRQMQACQEDIPSIMCVWGAKHMPLLLMHAGDTVDELALEQLLSPEALSALRQLMSAYKLKSCCYASAATGQGCKAALTSIAADLAGVPERLWVNGSEAKGGTDRKSNSSTGQAQPWFLSWACCLAPSVVQAPTAEPTHEPELHPYVHAAHPHPPVIKAKHSEAETEADAVPAVT